MGVAATFMAPRGRSDIRLNFLNFIMIRSHLFQQCKLNPLYHNWWGVATLDTLLQIFLLLMLQRAVILHSWDNGLNPY